MTERINTGLPTYDGGKNGNGTYQNLINFVPPHEIFITLFAGNCGLFRNIKTASWAVINDADPAIAEMWTNVLDGRYNCFVGNENALDILARKNYEYWALDQRDSFIYLDPPYLVETTRLKKHLYKHSLTEEQHQQLIDLVRGYKNARIMISHYACELYDTLLADDPERPVSWYFKDYPSMTRKGLATERIYFNYPPPADLHDYRYIGMNFRDREKLKRIKKNMLLKLDRLHPLLRNSILADVAAHYNR